MDSLPLFPKRFDINDIAVTPSREMGAYEALWLKPDATIKKAQHWFAGEQGLPSERADQTEASEAYREARKILAERDVSNWGIWIYGTSDYPAKLTDAEVPVKLLYYQGIWEFVESKTIAIVGTRKPSPEGIACAKRIAKHLVKHDYTVVSGLAAGIDTAAHESALEAGGRTIAVLGTPLGTTYPRCNSALQKTIAAHHLLVSPVPIVRHARQSPRYNRFFFPERNKVMSALSLATIIVEAGPTSGTLIQARAALYQKRKLFIMDRMFRRKDLDWPEKLLAQGAIRIKDIQQVIEHIKAKD